MDIAICHYTDEDFVGVFRAYIEDNEDPRYIDVSRWELVASIALELINTRESYLDWQKTIATYVANRARYEGYQTGNTTFEEW